MTRVFDDDNVPHETHFELVHTITRVTEWKHVEEFMLLRSPVTTGWNKQRCHMHLGSVAFTWELPKTPWTTQKYINMVQFCKDATALIGSGYYPVEEFF